MGGKKKRNFGAATNILQLYSGVDNKQTEPKKEEKTDKKKDDKESKRPQRRARIKLDNLMDKTPEVAKSGFTFGKNKQNEDSQGNEKDEDEEDINIEEEQCVQYEGYVYKYSQTQKKMKKTYFRLIGKDLYYYKKKEEEKHRGMHNLSGVFIKRGDLCRRTACVSLQYSSPASAGGNSSRSAVGCCSTSLW